MKAWRKQQRLIFLSLLLEKWSIVYQITEAIKKYIFLIGIQNWQEFFKILLAETQKLSW